MWAAGPGDAEGEADQDDKWLGAAADAEISSVVAGMAAGADSIDGLHVLRHGAMPALFGGIRAPSMLGAFLRAFTHGNALQLHAVHRRFLVALAARTPLLSGSGEKAFIDLDSTHKRVYGRTKQGAEYGRYDFVALTWHFRARDL
ncbi:hypothetical protein AADR41_01870 [Streptomyces sp. CLV115]|uniref:hypothetical protein n=1 Tax=Streptomyces sp. CLV115 TaxID=3138502 RepID=UPI00313D9548